MKRAIKKQSVFRLEIDGNSVKNRLLFDGVPGSALVCLEHRATAYYFDRNSRYTTVERSSGQRQRRRTRHETTAQDEYQPLLRLLTQGPPVCQTDTVNDRQDETPASLALAHARSQLASGGDNQAANN